MDMDIGDRISAIIKYWGMSQTKLWKFMRRNHAITRPQSRDEFIESQLRAYGESERAKALREAAEAVQHKIANNNFRGLIVVGMREGKKIIEQLMEADGS